MTMIWGMFIFFNDLQYANALISISVTEDGITISTRDEQSLNASKQILVTEEGMIIFVNDLQ